MNTKTIAMIGCAAIGVTLAAVVATKPSKPTPLSQSHVSTDRERGAEPSSPRIAVDAPILPPSVAPTVTAPAVRPQQSSSATAGTKNQQTKNANPQTARRGNAGGGSGQASNTASPPKDKPPERVALSMVGADPAAEAYWANAINNPNISAHDRSDLIEDLNEEGFEDPRNVNFDDLPLIDNRLAIIEQMAPSSMDEVNAAAFAEAYKDLINMRAKVVGQ